jgi:hypothetical protein
MISIVMTNTLEASSPRIKITHLYLQARAPTKWRGKPPVESEEEHHPQQTEKKTTEPLWRHEAEP